MIRLGDGVSRVYIVSVLHELQYNVIHYLIAIDCFDSITPIKS